MALVPNQPSDRSLEAFEKELDAQIEDLESRLKVRATERRLANAVGVALGVTASLSLVGLLVTLAGPALQGKADVITTTIVAAVISVALGGFTTGFTVVRGPRTARPQEANRRAMVSAYTSAMRDLAKRVTG
jgi:cytochrome c biogenesis protein CcdA